MRKRSTTTMQKILVALDFDKTISDCICDMHVQKLASNIIPEHIKKLYKKTGWNQYVNSVFRYLRTDFNVKENDYKECMKEVNFTKGMDNLIQGLAGDKYEVIIISDSNSFFIQEFLKYKSLSHVFRNIYTNEANFDENGCLKVSEYHENTCPMSTVNLCKGDILEKHISSAVCDNLKFSNVVYVGDGYHDLCPGLRLSENDLFCVKENSSLDETLSNFGKDKIRSDVLCWSDGNQILEKILQLVPP